ncbi:MAG: mobile mystery protein B [Pseudorhodobacter sp.]|nr:mobile mystery protein B [Frankiaceae bacterium]
MAETGDPWHGAGPSGSTPLETDELTGLRPSWVATRGDLNEAEQANILGARGLRRWRAPDIEYLLDDLHARRLHKDMFGDVWSWAGKYRITERNIGVDPQHIAVSVRDLLADARYWFAAGDVGVEAASRFHHRLVQIHPFPNGNGRHARELTDLLQLAVGGATLSWGGADLGAADEVRGRYIAALRAADAGDIAALTAFVQT